MTTTLLHGDCLDLMKDIADGSIDMILCDLPYGVLNKQKSKWDVQIPFVELWNQYERIIKNNGAIVLFGQGMFTAELMLSNKKMWRYNLIWKKGGKSTGFLNANRQPLRNHEDIVVFAKKQTVYNPQMIKCEPHPRRHGRGKGDTIGTNRCYGEFVNTPTVISDEKYPLSILDYTPEFKPVHPTQKPVPLLEYLIKTYTNEGEIVLDNCMGSGSTGIACINTNRNFIGIEKDDHYFEVAKNRIDEALKSVA